MIEASELMIGLGLPYGGGKHLWVLNAEEFTTIWQVSVLFMQI
jgi:hypothetical protein